MAKRLQHTVRFQDAEESNLAAVMAASAGVSMSVWLETAARERMYEWLQKGFPLDSRLAKRFTAQLEDALADVPGPAFQH